MKEDIKKEFREFIKSEDYSKIINESPVAVIGDWDGFKDTKSIHIAKRGFEKGLYEILGETNLRDKKLLIVREKRNPQIFFIGAFGKEDEREVFIAFGQLNTIKRDDLKTLGYNKPIQTSKVEIFTTRLAGLGKTFYKWFIYNKYTLISDMVQYDGARKLWDSLSRETKFNADVIDDQERKILKRDVRIDSGEEDWDFDSELWSYDFDKANIRFAIYKK